MRILDDLKVLSEYDVKNIHFEKILKTLASRRDILVNIVLIIATLFFMGRIYRDRIEKMQTLTEKVSELENRSEAIVRYEDTKKELSRFVGSLSQGALEAESIINSLNATAIDHDIQILTFTPRKKEGSSLYDLIAITINISARKYDDIGRFIRTIENSKKNLRVESWSSSPQSWQGGYIPSNISGSTESRITADVEITSLKFKE